MGNWLPKSVLCLKSSTKRMFVADLLAGITFAGDACFDGGDIVDT